MEKITTITYLCGICGSSHQDKSSAKECEALPIDRIGAKVGDKIRITYGPLSGECGTVASVHCPNINGTSFWVPPKNHVERVVADMDNGSSQSLDEGWFVKIDNNLLNNMENKTMDKNDVIKEDDISKATQIVGGGPVDPALVCIQALKKAEADNYKGLKEAAQEK